MRTFAEVKGKAQLKSDGQSHTVQTFMVLT